MRRPCRIEQLVLKAVNALLPDAEVVLIAVDIEETCARALAHLAEFDVPYLVLFDHVNEVAGRFQGFGARTISSSLTAFLESEGRVVARFLSLEDTQRHRRTR